jgi:hypothetical protein
VEHRHASTSPRSGLRGRFYTFVQSIKNSVNDICKTIPTIILNNKSGINGGGIPKHWNISGVHSRDARFYIVLRRVSVYKKTNLANVLDKIYNKTRYPVIVRIPLFSPFWNGGESTFYKMFDKPVIRGLMTYCCLSTSISN